MNIGDDVTINGRIVATSKDGHGELLVVKVRLKSGEVIIVDAQDINTVRPYQPRPETDRRTGS